MPQTPEARFHCLIQGATGLGPINPQAPVPTPEPMFAPLVVLLLAVGLVVNRCQRGS